MLKQHHRHTPIQYMESHRNGVHNCSALLRICEVKYIGKFYDDIVQIANEGRHIDISTHFDKR